MDKIGKQTLETMSQAKWYNEWLFGLMQKYLGNNILEIGAGTGNFTKKFIRKGEVTAVDIQKNYIDQLKKIKNEKLISGFGDVEKAKFFFNHNKKFDTAVALNVIEHIKDDDKALKNIYKLLNDNGKFIMLVPAHMFLYSNFDKKLGHYRRYDKKLVQDKLRKAGFSVVELKYLNWWAAIGWYVFLKLKGSQSMPSDKVKIFDKLGKLFLIPENYLSPPFGLSVFAVAKK